MDRDRDVKYVLKAMGNEFPTSRADDQPASGHAKKIELSLDVPKLGILTTARGQVVHELVLHQSFLFHELQRPT